MVLRPIRCLWISAENASRSSSLPGEPPASELSSQDSAAGPMREQLASVERKSIEDALAAEGGNQTRAARRLGISRRALIYKLAKYGIDRGARTERE